MAAKTVGTSKRRFWVMFFLGSAPDLDVIFNGLGSWAWVIQHRGLSHSIFGIALQALFYAWVLGRWDKGTFSRRAWQYSLPLSAHVVCDLLTAFGVPLLSPFSFKEFSVDLMVGLTLIPMFIMMVGLVWAYMRGEDGWRVMRPVWVGWALYAFMAISGKAYAAKLIETVPGAITLPSAGNPFTWSVICPDHGTQSYRRYELDLVRGRRLTRSAVPMPSDEYPIQASMESAAVKEFLKGNRWPVARVSLAGDGWDVEWGTLLLSTRGTVRGKLRLHVKADGSVASVRRIFTFWDPAAPDQTVASST